MIYTVTFNPALDYVVIVKHFTLGSINWTIRENIFHGSKGIDISVLLANLEYRSTAPGFIAGFTGREIEQGIRSLGFDSGFIQMEKGTSRINVKPKFDQENRTNGMGSEITDGDVERLFQEPSYLGKRDVLVLSGSIPAAISNDIYQRIMERLDGKGIRMAVDAERDLLQGVLQCHPFLIKPNSHELGRMFDQGLKTGEEIVLHARKPGEQRAVDVLVSMAGDGAILVTEDGDVHRQGVTRGAVKNSIGAGDSMVAGFMTGYLEEGDYAYVLKLGTVYGSAAVFSDDTGAKDEIMRLLNTL